jgi:hypothetical protein
MKYTSVGLVAAISLVACGKETGSVIQGGKLEGAPVATLSHDQLIVALHECTEYGPVDDPKVKYTVGYCAAVQSAHLSEGYNTPGTATADPTLNKMH